MFHNYWRLSWISDCIFELFLVQVLLPLKGGKANRKNALHKATNKWNPGSILTMLKHELYTGKRRFKTGKDPKTGNPIYETVYLEPIFNQDTFDRIQIQMKANAINKKKLDKYFYLVKDLIQCGNCGSSMHGRVKPNRAEYTYRCNSKRDIKSKCTSRGINIDKLNSIVWNAFLASIYYHKEINFNISNQFENTEVLNDRMNILQKELKKLEMDEKVLSERKTLLLKRGSDPRVLGIEYDSVMNEILSEQSLVQDNKTACLANIAMVNRQINDKDSEKSEIAKGVEAFFYAKLAVDSIGFPFKTKDMEQQARRIMKSYIKNIRIKYNPETRDHEVEIIFHDIFVINNEMKEERVRLKKVPSKKVKVKINERIKPIKNITFDDEIVVNGEKVVIKKTWGPTGQPLPPLNYSTKSLIVWCGERNGRVATSPVPSIVLPATE
jgi:Recombinase zinc beta ribbon domain/Recombinase